ncbi:MAG: hypothetical protein JWO36_7447 [Myxococcales bacterium]|nr:hypothetical protein [Myxococcales bacterium]
MSAGVGADVESLCSKCGDVWHVVVAKVGDKIVKVQCKQCGGQHRHKSPHGEPVEKRQPSLSNPKPPRSAAAASSRAPAERFEKPAVAADLSKQVRTYRASEKYAVGERVEHPSFGQGVIEVQEPGKITVFFATGRRVLAQSKDGTKDAGLTRPKPFDYSIVTGGKPVGES